MTGLKKKLTLKDVVICAAFIWAYQCARSVRSGGALRALSLDARADELWERLKKAGRAEILEEQSRRFHFLFKREYRTFLQGDDGNDKIEQMEYFLGTIGYHSEVESAREVQ